MKGIYKFTNKVTKEVYIGQSKHIEARWTQHLNAIDDVKFHHSLREYSIKNFTFEVLEENPNFTADDLDRLEKQYIKDYDSYNRGLNSTSGNGLLYNKKTPCKSRMLLVRGTINRTLYEKYLTNVRDKNILIIGNFKICDTLTLFRNNLTIITDDYDFDCEDAKQIIRVDTSIGIDELMAEVNKIEKNQFDLIIANPPYQYGNKIISKCVGKAKESIVLMPISCYKGQELYKHVLDLELADPKQFKDASITNNLNIARLCDRKLDQSWEQVVIESYDPAYRAFYELNASCNANYRYIPSYSTGDRQQLPPCETSFMITSRTIQNGAHDATGKAADIDYNINGINSNIPWSNRSNTHSCMFIVFSDKIAKQNLCRFWYKNELMDKLIKGLKSASGRMTIAIPNIDWTKDRDYEHCTLDDIMTWLREDNTK